MALRLLALSGKEVALLSADEVAATGGLIREIKRHLQGVLQETRFRLQLLRDGEVLPDDLVLDLRGDIELQVVILQLVPDYGEELGVAASNGDSSSVESLLMKAGDPNHATGPKPEAPLIQACRHVHVEVIQLLLEARALLDGALPAVADKVAGHPLRKEAVCLLLDARADVNGVCSSYSETALLSACERCDVPLAGLLIAARADVNEGDKWGTVPLLHACEGEDIELVSLLLAARAEVNKPDTQMTTPLMGASLGNSPELLELLVEHRADPNCADNCNHTTALHNATQAHGPDRLEMVECLLRLRSNIEAVTKSGVTPLMCASSQGSTAIMRCLIDARADQSKADFSGRTALMHATEKGAVTAIEVLACSHALRAPCSY